MTLELKNNPVIIGRRPTFESFIVRLADGLETTVHVARYRRNSVMPRLVVFDRETRLLDWCRSHRVHNAMNGGFFLSTADMPLGELWAEGVKQTTEPFSKPWNDVRGSLYITAGGEARIAPRYMFPQEVFSDLLQAGPLLVQNSVSTIERGVDPEGFSLSIKQFDDDITDGRHPRSAIGVNDDYIFSVACDGRNRTSAGLSLAELADVLIGLGVSDGLNLDGGSSATLISGGKMKNESRSGEPYGYALFEKGRPIRTAIVFETI